MHGWIHSSIARLSCGKSPLLHPLENLVIGGLQILPIMVREAKRCVLPQARCFEGLHEIVTALPAEQFSPSDPTSLHRTHRTLLLLHSAQHSHTQEFKKD